MQIPGGCARAVLGNGQARDVVNIHSKGSPQGSADEWDDTGADHTQYTQQETSQRHSPALLPAFLYLHQTGDTQCQRQQAENTADRTAQEGQPGYDDRQGGEAVAQERQYPANQGKQGIDILAQQRAGNGSGVFHVV